MVLIKNAWFVAAACVLLAGCEQTTTVSGTATYNGTPIESGAIMFSPVDDTGRNFGAMIKDGSFAIEEASPGMVKVIVTGQRKIDFLGTSSADAYAKGGKKQSTVRPGEDADYIPLDAEGNGQEVEIKPGDQTLEFAIKGPPA